MSLRLAFDSLKRNRTLRVLGGMSNWSLFPTRMRFAAAALLGAAVSRPMSPRHGTGERHETRTISAPPGVTVSPLCEIRKLPPRLPGLKLSLWLTTLPPFEKNARQSASLGKLKLGKPSVQSSGFA